MACNSDGPAVDHLEGPTEPKKSRPFSSPVSIYFFFEIDTQNLTINYFSFNYSLMILWA